MLKHIFTLKLYIKNKHIDIDIIIIHRRGYTLLLLTISEYAYKTIKRLNNILRFNFTNDNVIYKS